MDKGKVLIVDSNTGNPSSISEMLEEEGFATILAEDIEKVYELAVNEKPSIVLVDADLLNHNAWDLCRRLKDDYDARKSAIIILSSG